MNTQIEIVKTQIPKMADEIITLNLPDCYTMTIQKIHIEKMGQTESALEYNIIDSCGNAATLKNIPESVDDAREDILRAAKNSMNIRKSDSGMNAYLSGKVDTTLEKRGNTYKTPNAWARGF